MKPRIGFLGLGIMGRPMTINLLKAGFDVTAHNRTPRDFSELKEAGASMAASPAECVRRAEVVILMLTGPEACDAMLESEGVDLSGKLVVNMSSVPPDYSRELAGKVDRAGGRFVDAPVSGSQKPAQEGTLVILAGGDDADIDQAEEALLAMGKKVVRCGSAGSGAMMKMAVNLLLSVMMEGLAEMMDFGKKGGLSTETMLDVVLGGPLSNMLFELKREMFLTGEYPAQFPLKHMAKDSRFIVHTADNTGASIPCGRTAREFFNRAENEGLGEEDFAAVRKIL